MYSKYSAESVDHRPKTNRNSSSPQPHLAPPISARPALFINPPPQLLPSALNHIAWREQSWDLHVYPCWLICIPDARKACIFSSSYFWPYFYLKKWTEVLLEILTRSAITVCPTSSFLICQCLKPDVRSRLMREILPLQVKCFSHGRRPHLSKMMRFKHLHKNSSSCMSMRQRTVTLSPSAAEQHWKSQAPGAKDCFCADPFVDRDKDPRVHWRVSLTPPDLWVLCFHNEMCPDQRHIRGVEDDVCMFIVIDGPLKSRHSLGLQLCLNGQIAVT